MNKLISVQQRKKTVDFLDDQEEDNLDDEDISDELHDVSCSFPKNVTLSSCSSKESHFFINTNNSIILNNCQNEKCIENLEEIEKMNEKINSLEKRILILDKQKAEEFFEISSKLNKVCKNIDTLQPLLDSYQGINLGHLSYENLAKVEINLMRLLIKVRHSVSKIESAVMKKIIPKPEDNTTLCKKCEVNNINCLLHPCSHVVLCVDCTTQSTRCPVCHKFIDYYDKIYLPNVNWG